MISELEVLSSILLHVKLFLWAFFSVGIVFLPTSRDEKELVPVLIHGELGGGGLAGCV